MLVNEIFLSCQGEGVLAGVPMVFVRLQGCNLRCFYCDTTDAQSISGGHSMSVSEIARAVMKLSVVTRGTRWVCITGGNPLVQERELRSLIKLLTSKYRCFVEVEDNGSISPPTWVRQVNSWCIDVKCPSSGELDSFDPSWLGVLTATDQIKFVVANDTDLLFIRQEFLPKLDSSYSILISPAFYGELLDRSWLQAVWDFCCAYGFRYNLQLHKVIHKK